MDIMTKRSMKDEHFQELLTSVHQMGDHLRGKKVRGVKITYKTKSANAKNSKPSEAKKITREMANVYADIGVKDAKGMLAKAQLAFKIDEFIRSRKLSKIKAARTMEISQPQLGELLKGRFRETSIAQIKMYLKRLEIDEDPLAEDMSGYIGKLKWRKATFKFAPNDGTQKAIRELEQGEGRAFKSVKALMVGQE